MDVKSIGLKKPLVGLALAGIAGVLWFAPIGASHLPEGGDPGSLALAGETVPATESGDRRVALLVSSSSLQAMGQARAGTLATPDPGNVSQTVAAGNPGSGEASFPGALFATLLALIGVVTVTRRGMSK